MKSTLVAGVALGLVLVASPSFAAKKNYKADIEGGNVGSPGTGVGNFTFDDVTKKFCGTATYTGLTGGVVTAVALKNANDASLVKPLTASGSPIIVNLTLTDEEILLLDAAGPGDLYIAIGNAMYGVGAGENANGEVNGEIEPDPAGMEQPCPGEVTDAGTSSGAPVDSGSTSSSGASGTSGDPNTSSSGDVPTEGDAPAPKKKDDGGCSTTGSASSGGVVLAAVASLLIASRTRSRRRR